MRPLRKRSSVGFKNGQTPSPPDPGKHNAHQSLVQGIPRQEKAHEQQQGSVDQQQLLVASHAVGAKPVLLVLGKPRHHLHTRLKPVLRGAADGAHVILREVLGREGGRGRRRGFDTSVCKISSS